MAFTLTESSITESTWVRDFAEDTRRASWLEQGLAHFAALCRSYSIDQALIAEPAPYVPNRIATLCVLCACYRDNLGSSWREVADNYSLDLYKSKLEAAQAELAALLPSLTPGACGYTPDPSIDQAGGSMSFTWARG